MRRMFRFQTFFTLLALCLLVSGMTARVAAQDDPTATSPIVGVWLAPPLADDTGSIISFSSDGIVADQETDGTFASGAWAATDATTGTATFVFFMNSDEFSGSIIIRVALAYDEASDTLTATYNVTGAAPDGSVPWADEESVSRTLTRMPVEGPDMVGQPLDGLIAPAAEATPVA